MYDFNQHLDVNETILYTSRPAIGKGDKSITGHLFIITFMAFMQILMILSLVYGWGDGGNGINFSFIIIFAVTLLFDGIAIYGIAYNKFIKKRAVADDYYCITNKRALKYESKKDKLVYGYLDTYQDIHTMNVKGGYGDLYMGIVMEESSDPKETLFNLKEAMLHPDPSNMPTITFECIYKPNKVKKIIEKAIQEFE